MTETNVAKPISAKKLKANLGQALLSFSFDIGGLLSGTLLVLYFDVFSIKEAPWVLILFPGILSVRGAIGGVFSGHLSTGLHIGTVKASYTKNTKEFRILLQAVITLALISGIAVGIGTSAFGVFLWNATVLDLIKLLAVIVATMGLSAVCISPITIAFSVLSFRRGLDPDVIVYPITSTASDIIITACYIFSLKIFFESHRLGYFLIGALDLVFLLLITYILVKNFNEEKYVRMIKEFLLTLVFVIFIVNITGSLLDKIGARMRNGKEIYIVYPAVITTVGGVGSIVGSTATTKLALGLAKASFSSIKHHLNEVTGSWLASIAMFTIYGITSSFMNEASTLGNALEIATQLLATNILAVPVMTIVAYGIAVSTYRRGLDPDNFVIPIESSLADSITTLSLLIALTLIA